SATVQEHPLIGFTDPEHVAYFLAGQSIDVPKRYDGALALWQPRDGFSDLADHSCAREAVINVLGPVGRWIGPLSPDIEARTVDGSGIVDVDGGDSLLSRSGGTGPVGQDAENP